MKNLDVHSVGKLDRIREFLIPERLKESRLNDSVDSNIFFRRVYDGGIPTDYTFWSNFKKSNNSKFFYDTHQETLNIVYTADLVATIIDNYSIDPAQIYILVPDEVHKKSLADTFNKKNIYKINIDFFNKWLESTPIPTNNSFSIEKRFNVFSRSYKIDRLNLYLELVKNNLLDNFFYTFYNIHPYTKAQTDIKIIAQHIYENYPDDYEKLLKWALQIPYTYDATEDAGFSDIYSDKISSKILRSGISVINETLFSESLSGFVNKDVTWITEKTYKVIACKKPFIMYNTQHSLKTIHKLGYKTFSPFINEEYDNIEDHELRRSKIITEIKRISLLTNNEFELLLKNCKEICEHNYDVFINKKKHMSSIKYYATR